jgi:hypothetical protein
MNSGSAGFPWPEANDSLDGMPVKTQQDLQKLSIEELRPRIVSELTRDLPDIGTDQLEREVRKFLDDFGDPPVKVFLPVLVGRRVRELHR